MLSGRTNTPWGTSATQTRSLTRGCNTPGGPFSWPGDGPAFLRRKTAHHRSRTELWTWRKERHRQRPALALTDVIPAEQHRSCDARKFPHLACRDALSTKRHKLGAHPERRSPTPQALHGQADRNSPRVTGASARRLTSPSSAVLQADNKLLRPALQTPNALALGQGLARLRRGRANCNSERDLRFRFCLLCGTCGKNQF